MAALHLGRHAAVALCAMVSAAHAHARADAKRTAPALVRGPKGVKPL